MLGVRCVGVGFGYIDTGKSRLPLLAPGFGVLESVLLGVCM